MVKFDTAWITNFLSVASAEIILNDQGLVLIEGVNQDDPSAKSNGAGKSSLMDAICWCLYGYTARGMSGDNIIHIPVGKDCKVVLKVLIDGDTYFITRGRKDSKIKNRVEVERRNHDGTVTVLTKGTDKLTQVVIDNLIGCNQDTFVASIYMGQENMPDLPGMTDKELKAILEEALGLDKLDLAHQMANEDFSVVKVQKANTDTTMMNLKTEALELKGLLEGLVEDIKKLDNIKKDFVEANKPRVENLEEEIVFAKMELFTLESKSYPISLVEVDNLRDAHSKFISDANEKRTELQRELYDEERYAIELEARIAALEGSKDCPTCGKPHDKVDGDEELIAEMKGKLSLRVKSIKKKEREFDAIETKILTRTSSTDEAVKIKMVAFSDEMNIRTQIFNTKTKLEVKIKELENLNDSIRINVEKYDYALNVELKTKDNYRTKLRAVLDKTIALGKYSVEVNSKLGDLEIVTRTLSRKGFRGELLDQVTPYLNSRTAYYLDTLSDGNITAVWMTISENSYGEYTENFHIEIKHSSGVEKFQLLSGGEKRKVRLACALALQDLVATRAVKPIHLFIADEIDHAIDDSGLELLMGVLETKATEMGSVFIISHNSLKDWCRNRIVVTKKDKVSTIEKVTD